MMGQRGSFVVRALVAAGAFWLAATPSRAAAIWCGVPDAADQKIYMSNPVAVRSMSKPILWRYSARFIDAINGRYAAHLPPVDSACRAADTTAAADRALLRYRSDYAAPGLMLVIVGVF